MSDKCRSSKRKRIWNKDPHCFYCGFELEWEESTADHIIPRAEGGSNDRANLVIACNSCNELKGSNVYLDMQVVGDDADFTIVRLTEARNVDGVITAGHRRWPRWRRIAREIRPEGRIMWAEIEQHKGYVEALIVWDTENNVLP